MRSPRSRPCEHCLSHRAARCTTLVLLCLLCRYRVRRTRKSEIHLWTVLCPDCKVPKNWILSFMTTTHDWYGSQSKGFDEKRERLDFFPRSRKGNSTIPDPTDGDTHPDYLFENAEPQDDSMANQLFAVVKVQIIISVLSCLIMVYTVCTRKPLNSNPYNMIWKFFGNAPPSISLQPFGENTLLFPGRFLLLLQFLIGSLRVF